MYFEQKCAPKSSFCVQILKTLVRMHTNIFETELDKEVNTEIRSTGCVLVETGKKIGNPTIALSSIRMADATCECKVTSASKSLSVSICFCGDLRNLFLPQAL